MERPRPVDEAMERPRPASGVRLDILQVAQLYEQRAASLAATGHDPSEAYSKALEMRIKLFGPRHKIVFDHLHAAVRAIHTLALQDLDTAPEKTVRTLGKAVNLLHWYTGRLRGAPRSVANRPRSAGPVPSFRDPPEVRSVLATLQCKTLNNLAQAYTSMGDHERAATYLAQALRLDVPEEELAATHVAYCSLPGPADDPALRLHHAEEAVRLGEAAILGCTSLKGNETLFRDKVSVLVVAYHNLGVVLEDAGKPASEPFERARLLAEQHLPGSDIGAACGGVARAEASARPPTPPARSVAIRRLQRAWR